MDTIKLQEALAEIESKIAILDEAAHSIRKAVSALAGTAANPAHVRSQDQQESEVPKRTVHHRTNKRSPKRKQSRFGPSYIDESETAMRSVGHPLHISELVEALSANRGMKIDRGSLEGSIYRHMKKSKSPRIIKVGPSKYGLPEWKPTLAQTA